MFGPPALDAFHRHMEFISPSITRAPITYATDVADLMPEKQKK
jgi:hypothetical protein